MFQNLSGVRIYLLVREKKKKITHICIHLIKAISLPYSDNPQTLTAQFIKAFGHCPPPFTTKWSIFLRRGATTQRPTDIERRQVTEANMITTDLGEWECPFQKQLSALVHECYAASQLPQALILFRQSHKPIFLKHI